MRAELAIKGGTVVTASGTMAAHVYVADGRIVGVGDQDEPADEIVDGTGLFVLPGMVDTHVHLMDPGETDREDFPTGTAAAIAAGVTTIVEHTHTHPIRGVDDLEDKKGYLEGRSNADFGLAAHTWPDRIDDLRDLWSAGITFFKIFTCTTHGVPGLDTNQLEDALAAISAFDGVCLIHCEDEAITSSAEAKLRSEGRTDNSILVEWRSEEAELVAVEETCRLVAKTGARATIAHVSSPAVAGIVQRAREDGADVAAETCPQYFALRRDEVLSEGPLRKFTPPARANSDDDEASMWRALHAGAISHISTDHAPSTRAQKGRSIWEAPFGLPGLDTTTPFLLDAVHRGRLTLEDVVRVYSEAPARRYGLHPRKGQIAVGADADLLLVSDSGSWEVSDADVISRAGWSPFTGRTFSGSIHACYLRGRLVARDRSPVGEPTGRFLSGSGAGQL